MNPHLSSSHAEHAGAEILLGVARRFGAAETSTCRKPESLPLSLRERVKGEEVEMPASFLPLCRSAFASGVQGAGYRVRGTGYRVRGTGYRVRGTGYGVRGTGYGTGYGVRKREMIRDLKYSGKPESLPRSRVQCGSGGSVGRRPSFRDNRQSLCEAGCGDVRTGARCERGVCGGTLDISSTAARRAVESAWSGRSEANRNRLRVRR